MSFSGTRRKFLQAAAALGATGALAMVGDGTILEANRPELVSLEIPLPRLGASWDGVRIVQLSDFHYDDYFSVVPIRKAVDIVNGLQPDLVVLTGDFVTSPVSDSRRGSARRAAMPVKPCCELLVQMRSSGILAVLGNHDMGTDPAHVTNVLQAHDIPVLKNRSVAIERHGQRLWICGVDDILAGKPNLELAMKGIPNNEPVILLAHEPDWADYVSHYPVDLQLSGHSHGGQVRIPLIGAVYLPPLARKYPWGLRRIGSLVLYTNAGLGTIRVPMRFHCPPEVTLITLRAANTRLQNPTRQQVGAAALLHPRI